MKKATFQMYRFDDTKQEYVVLAPSLDECWKHVLDQVISSGELQNMFSLILLEYSK